MTGLCQCGAPILISETGESWACSDPTCVHGEGLRTAPRVGLAMCLVCLRRPRARKHAATCDQPCCRAAWRRFMGLRFPEGVTS
jgi:hypothetical protein